MTPRDASYVLEIVDDIPQRTIEKSPLEPTLEKIAADYEAQKAAGNEKPITAIIALYGKPSACTAAANVLRQRHGTQDVEGWRFETRHVDRKDPETGEEVTKTALFVNYDPTKMVPGGREAWDKKMADREKKLEAKRAAKTATGSGSGGGGNGSTNAQPTATTQAPAPPQAAQGTTSTAPQNADKVATSPAPSPGNPPVPAPAAAQPTAPGKTAQAGAQEPAGAAPKK